MPGSMEVSETRLKREAAAPIDRVNVYEEIDGAVGDEEWIKRV